MSDKLFHIFGDQSKSFNKSDSLTPEQIENLIQVLRLMSTAPFASDYAKECFTESVKTIENHKLEAYKSNDWILKLTADQVHYIIVTVTHWQLINEVMDGFAHVYEVFSDVRNKE